MENITFYNGNEMPIVGLGTFRVENNDECAASVKHAIENGYTHIDTAMIYENEDKVGQGIAEGLASTGYRLKEVTYSLLLNYGLMTMVDKMSLMRMRQV